MARRDIAREVGFGFLAMTVAALVTLVSMNVFQDNWMNVAVGVTVAAVALQYVPQWISFSSVWRYVGAVIAFVIWAMFGHVDASYMPFGIVFLALGAFVRWLNTPSGPISEAERLSSANSSEMSP